MSKISENVKTIIEPIINKLGYDLIDVDYFKKADGMNLTVFIDSKDGIKIEDCEIVHKAIDEPLDTLDPTNGNSYILNVSSCGLDRPLNNDVLLKNNLGKDVEVSLYAKFNGKKLYIGGLKNFDDNTITILVLNNELTFDRKSIAKIMKHISF